MLTPSRETDQKEASLPLEQPEGQVNFKTHLQTLAGLLCRSQLAWPAQPWAVDKPWWTCLTHVPLHLWPLTHNPTQRGLRVVLKVFNPQLEGKRDLEWIFPQIGIKYYHCLQETASPCRPINDGHLGSLWKLQLIPSLFILSLFICRDVFCPWWTNANSWSLTNEIKIIISILRANCPVFVYVRYKKTCPKITDADCISTSPASFPSTMPFQQCWTQVHSLKNTITYEIQNKIQ